jgi:hypothetical protein
MMKKTLTYALALLLALAPFAGVRARAFTAPVAVSFSTAVPVTAQSLIQLQGSDADGTSLTYATTTSPAHGALSQLNTSTGAVVYTPAAGYTGADSFNYTVTSGGDTTGAATVTITVTAAQTRVVETFTNPDATPRQGKVSFFLTQVASSPSGVIPAKASVSCRLSSTGVCDVSLYPSRAVSPVQFYQAWFDDSATGNSQLIGVYDIPASTTTISLAGHRITDANLGAQFAFASRAEIEVLTRAVAAATFQSLLGSNPTDGRLQKYDAATGKFKDSLVGESGSTVSVAGSANATGTVTATEFIGSGAGLHSLPSGVVTPNSLSSTGSTSLNADTDGTGDGEAALVVNGVTKFRAKAGGAENESLVPLKLPDGGAAISDKDKRLQSAINVSTCATGGAGTLASPWTGWNNNGNCVWTGKAYYFGGLADGTPGVYETSTVVNWSKGALNGNPSAKPIWVEGNNATINCTGTGLRCITIASATDANATWLHGIRIENLKVRNTGTWSEGLYISGNLGCVYESLDIAWFTDKNFHFRGVVQDHFNLINSYPEPGEPSTAYPIWIAGDLLSSDNDFLGLDAVQASGASIYVGLCQNSRFTGTGEGNAATGGLGLICNTDCRSNVFIMDNEGNELGGTGRDFSIDGHNNVFISTMSTGMFRLTSGAKENLILGGLFNSIQVDAGARSNEFRSVRYNLTGSGTFVDNGTNTKYSACNFLGPTLCKVNDTTAFRPDGVNLQSEHEVVDGAQLSGGTVTVTMDASVAFATTAYTCSLTNVTAARALQFTPLSGTQFRVDGTGTDSFTYRCKGH